MGKRKASGKSGRKAGLLDELVEESTDAIYVLSAPDGRIVDCNRRALAALGYNKEDLLGLGVFDIEQTIPGQSDWEQHVDILSARLHGVFQGRHVTHTGESFPVEVNATYIDRDDGYVIAVARDMREREQFESALHIRDAYFRQLFENTPQAVVILDIERQVVDVNSRFERLFGYSCEELRGGKLEDVLVPPEGRDEASEVAKHLYEGEFVHFDAHRQHRDGTLIPCLIRGYPIRHEGQVLGAYGIYTDVVDDVPVGEEQDQRDPLTGQMNRAGFEARLKEVLQQAHSSQASDCLLMVNIDRFRVLNETLGYVAGDELLRRVATVLRDRVRTSDLVARIGGDEFALLLGACPLEAAERIAEDIAALCRDMRFDWQGQEFQAQVSIGLVEIVPEMSDSTATMGAADVACMVAKESGGNRVAVYSPDDEEYRKRRSALDWVGRLNRAIEKDRFVLFFQKITRLQPGSPGEHLEVLVRMVGDNGEIIPPGDFIPAAERFNMMQRVDRWVIQHSLNRLAQSQYPSPEMVAINVSATSLADKEFPRFVRDCFTKTGVSPEIICFEITETAAITYMEDAHVFIEAVRALGCRIALDDFGTGMSSFGYLRTLSVDYLKIDGTFVKNMVDDPIDSAMVEAIQRVGQVMGIQTVAEFVEDKQTADALRELGVDFAQGFGLHRPEKWDA